MGNCFYKKQKTTKKRISDISNILYEDTVPYIFPISMGKVIKVYDGDTITVGSTIENDPTGKIYRFSIRLKGIDTPEIKGGGTCHEKQLAIQARDALHDLIFGKLVVIKNVGNEKYGRILADIWLNDIHVNQWMLEHKYAVVYDGGKKQTWIK